MRQRPGSPCLTDGLHLEPRTAVPQQVSWTLVTGEARVLAAPSAMSWPPALGMLAGFPLQRVWCLPVTHVRVLAEGACVGQGQHPGGAGQGRRKQLSQGQWQWGATPGVAEAGWCRGQQGQLCSPGSSAESST